MKNILEALSKMGKATAREMAACLKIDVRELLDMLREHQDGGEVSQVNGYWQLTADSGVKQSDTPVNAPKRSYPKRVKTTEPTVAPVVIKINETILAALMNEHGALTTERMAALTGTTVRGVASTLARGVNKGRITRVKKGSVFHFSLSCNDGTQVEQETVETATETDTLPVATNAAKTSSFVDSIPQLLHEKKQLMVMTPKVVASEIRKTKCRLVQLEKLRVAVINQARLQRSLGLLE
ncbi:DUF1627 domain-containing protein [Buttiauxella sp. B2]|uniref:DUF1627 domain-containing protein n=1 Tax=Buttiauxella sp. B2 TaxID=2587812 RepID=UPI0011240FFC|nr:DUF1627 domain-containing protein [Buttiauxella sp. B2]TNV22849.1 DUF1627 domain-containing protein [Buttiauxella sp. B2]